MLPPPSRKRDLALAWYNRRRAALVGRYGRGRTFAMLIGAPLVACLACCVGVTLARAILQRPLPSPTAAPAQARIVATEALAPTQTPPPKLDCLVNVRVQLAQSDGSVIDAPANIQGVYQLDILRPTLQYFEETSWRGGGFSFYVPCHGEASASVGAPGLYSENTTGRIQADRDMTTHVILYPIPPTPTPAPCVLTINVTLANGGADPGGVTAIVTNMPQFTGVSMPPGPQPPASVPWSRDHAIELDVGCGWSGTVQLQAPGYPPVNTPLIQDLRGPETVNVLMTPAQSVSP